MNDTTPRAEALFHRLLTQRSGSERLKLAGEMFPASRALLAVSLRDAGLQPGTAAWKLALLDRVYGDEISAAQRARLAARWTADEDAVRAGNAKGSGWSTGGPSASPSLT